MPEYRLRLAVGLCLAAAMVSGCAPQKPSAVITFDGVHFPAVGHLNTTSGFSGIRYDGVFYASRDEAAAALHANTEAAALRVPQAAQRIPGSLLVALPTWDELREVEVAKHPTAAPETLDFMTDLSEAITLTNDTLIAKSGLFSSVTLIRSSQPGFESIDGYDYKLSMDRLGNGWLWRLARNGAGGRLIFWNSPGTILPALVRTACGLGGLVTNADPTAHGDPCHVNTGFNMAGNFGFNGMGFPPPRLHRAETPDSLLRAGMARVNADIHPSAERIEGSALIVLPSWDRFRAATASDALNPGLPLYDTLAAVAQEYALTNVAYIQKSRIFDDTELQRAEHPAATEIGGYGYKIWEEFDDNRPEWYIEKSGGGTRELSWTNGNALVKTVLETAGALGGRIRPAAEPAPAPVAADVPEAPRYTPPPPPAAVPETAPPAPAPQAPFDRNDLMP